MSNPAYKSVYMSIGSMLSCKGERPGAHGDPLAGTAGETLSSNQMADRMQNMECMLADLVHGMRTGKFKVDEAELKRMQMARVQQAERDQQVEFQTMLARADAGNSCLCMTKHVQRSTKMINIMFCNGYWLKHTTATSSTFVDKYGSRSYALYLNILQQRAWLSHANGSPSLADRMVPCR